MKRKQLLNMIDSDLIDRLYGYCYRRTASGHEAEGLCSDILFALVRAGNAEGELREPEAFIWRVAHNVYANYSEGRHNRTAHTIAGDPDELIARMADNSIDETDEDRRKLAHILHEIAFLSAIYRNVTVDYYLDGLSTAAIAKKHGIAEVTVRQRLFSARDTIRKGVRNMEKTMEKPLALEKINLNIWGSGNPLCGDPREVCTRQLSKHIVWMCKQKPVTAPEVSTALHLPTLYAEEELNIQCRGMNGKYGLLRKLDNGRYTLNFVLLDEKEVDELQNIYLRRIPEICDRFIAYLEANKESLLALPYLNRNKDINLILWSIIKRISNILDSNICNTLSEVMGNIPEPDRPFSVFGWRCRQNEPHYGSGMDGIHAQDICGYSYVTITNIYNQYIKAHFHCAHNISTDKALQLAIRAVEGLDVATLSEGEREYAAKAIECGYLYREGDTLYTKIVTYREEDSDRILAFADNFARALQNEWFDIASEIASFIKKAIPEHLIAEYRYVNDIAALPLFTKLTEALLEYRLLKLPERELGAEGCWMTVKK